MAGMDGMGSEGIGKGTCGAGAMPGLAAIPGAAPVGPDAQRRPPPPLPSPDLYATDCGVGPKYSSWSPMMLSRGVLALQSPPQMAECRAQLV
jgi:hypothetical protein